MTRCLATVSLAILVLLTLVGCGGELTEGDKERPAAQERTVAEGVQRAVTAAPASTPNYAPAPLAPAATPVRRASAATPAATAKPPTGQAGPSGPTGWRTPAPAPQAGAPPATDFQDYIRERFVSAALDNVSTFGLDTDRTSYYLALNWAREGYEVDPDSVRAEEWINAFNYQYEPPLRDDSFAVTSDVFGHPLDSRMHMARIAFQAPQMNYDATPVNVTLVLDASGSMDTGNRVDIARQAAESIRSSLSDRDRIAVVHFSSEVISSQSSIPVPTTGPWHAQSMI